MSLARIFSSLSEVNSSFANPSASPVLGSIRSCARILPTRSSTCTTKVLMPAFVNSRTCFCLIRSPALTMVRPSMAISELAVSPCRRSGAKSRVICSPSIRTVLVSKKISRIRSLTLRACGSLGLGSSNNARNRMVTGSLRRRSMRAYSTSLTSNSKSSHDPR